MEYDLIVAGGGISGCAAAISAARCGLDVLLVERCGFLGGTLTANGTGPMMTFHAGDRQVVRGITGELIDRLQAKGSSPGHIFDTTGYTFTVTPFDAEAMKRELETMLLEAGGKLRLHSLVCGVERRGNRIESVTVCGKDGMKTLKAKVFIDATADADLSRFSGLPVTVGREADGKCQPVTLNMKLYNVDIPRARAHIAAHPEDFPRMDCAALGKAPRLSVGGYNNTFAMARSSGEISFDREFLLYFETNNPGEVIVNTTRISGIDPLDPESLTRAELEGRRQCAEVFAFVRRRIPGFENAVMAFTGPFIGVRGSAQIRGRYTLTETDLLTCREFSDTVAHGAYPIDIHPPEGADDAMFDIPKLSGGTFYSIPYRSLIGECENLITVGRCISATFGAQAAIRVSPIAGAIGHGGGAAAAVALGAGVPVQRIDPQSLRQLLLSQGAFLKERK